MIKPALVIIYNHQYNKNIEPLEKLYSERFSRIFHLVPFYEGKKHNVIPVYENSFYFQGYVAQAWNVLKKSDCDDFIFIGDDLLVNPFVNESNYRLQLGIDENTSFIPELLEFHHRSRFWWRCKDAVEWVPYLKGLEVEGMLPSVDEAMRHYARHSLSPSPIPAYLVNPNYKKNDVNGQKLLQMKYPLIGSYSDIFAAPRAVMDKFSHYCGIFAAMRLFVEVAIPSALAMASPKITSEAQTVLKGQVLGNQQEPVFLAPYGSSLSKLLNNFPDKTLYIHPVKLSRWKD